MVLARKTHGDPGREDEAQVGEDRIPGGGHEGQVEEIGLAEPQQQPRHRQHGDREHQGAAQRLEPLQARRPHARSPI